jgi:nucleoside triphosphatase
MKSAYPEPVVGALIFNPDNDFLLIKSHKWNNLLVIPGGHIEIGESIEDALRREVREETSLEIYDIVFLGIQEYIKGKEYCEDKHFIFLDFVCRTNNSDVLLNSEAEYYIWISVEKSRTVRIERHTNNVIMKYFKNQKGLAQPAKCSGPAGHGHFDN